MRFTFSRAILVLVLTLVSGLATIPSVSAAAGTTTDASSPQVTTGGRFILRDQNNRVVTDQDFAGKYMLVYFGYTYCPDICPTSLQIIGHAMDLLGKEGDVIQPVFITVDPERDTPSVLRDYVAAFHPRLIGLTGSKAAIQSVAKKYRVRFAKVAEKGAINDDYLIDHTAAVFLMGPDGRYITRFTHNTTAKQMAKKLRELIAEPKNK